MALTGHFDADFTAFYDAVDKAQVSIKGFDADAQTLNKDLSSMVDEFSGRKIITEATLMAKAVEDVGGVAHLTADELQRVGAVAQEAADKMKAWGGEIPANIQKLADAAKKTEGDLGDFGKTIKSAIEDPLGTAGEALGGLADAMGPAGVAALGYASAVGAVGVALFELTEKAATLGGHLEDVSAVTGMTVPEVSRLSNAATVAGTDLGTLSNAMLMMNQRMAESPDKFEKGLERINLNFADFIKLSPADRLIEFSEALNATDDPIQRTAAGVEIMGRGFRSVEPSLLKLNEALEKTADIPVWTAAQAKQAEEFEMDLAAMKVHAEAFAISIGQPLIGPIDTFIQKVGWAKDKLDDWGLGFGGIASPVGVAKQAIAEAGAVVDQFRGTAGQTDPIIDALTKKQDALTAAFDKSRAQGATLTDGLNRLKEVQKDLDPLTQKSITQHLQEQAAYADLATVGANYHETLNNISGDIVESVIFYKDQGIQLSELKKIWPELGDAAWAAIEKERQARANNAKETEKELTAQAKLEAKTIDETTKLWDAYELQRTKQMGTTTDIARAENEKQYEDAAANANKMGIVDAQYWDALEARWKQKNEAIGIDWSALTKAATTESKAGLQQIADGAAATYQEALKHVGEWSDASIDKFRVTAEEAQKAADMFGTGWETNAKKASAAISAMADDTIGSIHAITAASASATIPQGAQQPYPDTIEGRLKSLADEQARYGSSVAINTSGLFGGLRSFGVGGSGDFGAGTPVMLHGKEAIVPLEDDATNVQYGAPRTGGGSAATVVQQFYITQPFGTPEAIARAVQDAQVALLKGQGARLPFA